MLKKILMVVTFLGLFSGCVGVDPQGRGYSVAIPLNVINSTLAQKFPVTERVKYGIISGNLDISDPNILGESGSDKLGVGTSFKFTNMFIPNGISGTINLASGIRYDANTKNLYLKNPMVNSIKFQNESLLSKLPDGIQNAIGVVVSETIAKKPIYNLEKSTGVATSFVRGIDVRDGQVFITFGL
ncbi:MAG: DUF1439 domain-containing protein [Epsilonproteobacteria bacterium]|nr:DUF1439 domain-containing protein [Campylobacterota bacterium]